MFDSNTSIADLLKQKHIPQPSTSVDRAMGSGGFTTASMTDESLSKYPVKYRLDTSTQEALSRAEKVFLCDFDTVKDGISELHSILDGFVSRWQASAKAVRDSMTSSLLAKVESLEKVILQEEERKALEVQEDMEDIVSTTKLKVTTLFNTDLDRFQTGSSDHTSVSNHLETLRDCTTLQEVRDKWSSLRTEMAK